MEHIENFAKKIGLDRFERNQHVVTISTATKVKPIVIIFAAFVLVSILLLATRIGRLLIETTLVFFYPAFKSFQAIQTASTEDDKRWLTYWVTFGFFYGFEQSFGFMIGLIPMWPLLRFGLFVFLMLPQYNAPTLIYEKAVQPIFTSCAQYIDPLLESAESGLKKFGDKAKTVAAEKLAANLVKTD